MRLIDADELLTAFPAGDEPMVTIACIRATIEHMPTIEERKTGRWIDSGIHSRAFDIFGVRTWASRMMCDQCGFVTHAIEGSMEQYNFCPNCGADMRGV